MGKFHANIYALVALMWVGAATSGAVLLTGLGLEAVYLVWMMNRRPAVGPLEHTPGVVDYVAERDRLLPRLDVDGRARFLALDGACSQLVEAGGAQYSARFETLLDLALVYLRLLVVRCELANPTHTKALESRLAEVRTIYDASDGAQKRSLKDTIDLLERRLALVNEGAERIGVVDAELMRIEQQVALLADQAKLGPDTAALAQQVDAVVWTLQETNQWLDQNTLLEEV